MAKLNVRRGRAFGLCMRRQCPDVDAHGRTLTPVQRRVVKQATTKRRRQRPPR